MVVIKTTIEFVFSMALFLNAILFIPQAVRIFKEKTAAGISFITFLGFLVIQFSIILHAIIVRDSLLLFGYFFSFLTCGVVVFLILFYRKHDLLNDRFPLEKIIAQFPGHIYWKNRDFTFAGSNTNNWKDFGLSSLSEFIGKTDYDLFSKKEADQIRIVDKEVMREDKIKIVEELLTKPDGSNVLYLSHKQPLKNKNGKIIGILGCSIDITAAKQKTLDQLTVLENVIAVMPGNVYWMDKNGIYLGCNDNEAKAVGLKSRKDIIGKKNVDIPGFVIPEALDPVNKEVMEMGKSVTLEEPAVLLDGTKAIFLSSKVPIKNSRNEIVGMVGISIDITQQKQSEEALRQEKIKSKLQEERLQVLKSVGASVAHELRTPLRSISSAASSVILYLPELLDAYGSAKEAGLPVKIIRNKNIELLKSLSEDIMREIDSVNTIINMLLMNIKESNMLPKEFEELHMNQCVQEALERYPFQKRHKSWVVWENSKEKDFIFRGNKLLFEHIIFNLMKNALYYVEKAHGKSEGKITIKLEKGDQENRLYFRDNGTGISQEVLPKIFDDFFSKTIHGTGIGLSFCRAAIEKMNGSIDCRSKEGEFTEFVLSFPVIKSTV